MRWWVYEDDPTSLVRVHVASCSHGNDGRGRQPPPRADNRWHGPFGTKQAATGFALGRGAKDSADCSVCGGDTSLWGP